MFMRKLFQFLTIRSAKHSKMTQNQQRTVIGQHQRDLAEAPEGL